MSDNNKRNLSDDDKTGDILSWVIVFIFMFALPPVGWLLLFFKMRGYAKKTTTTKRPKKRNPLLKKTGRFISLVLLLISIAMVILSFTFFTGTIQQFITERTLNWPDLVWGAFYFTGGLGAFFSRNIVARRYSRYKNYYAFIDGRGIVPISDIAQMAGVKPKTAIRDIQTMINNRYLDDGAYIDSELDCLVLSAKEAEKLRKELRESAGEPEQPDEMTESQYAALVAELREVNEFIKDDEISKKVDRLEELTAKIFRIVEETPEKRSQIRRFLSYYLPTTLKLLRSYAMLEKQGVKGENIMSAKKSIGNILDTLATGYEQQLDQLFSIDAIDIAADINVLENLMQQDGLTGDKSEFQVMESGT